MSLDKLFCILFAILAGPILIACQPALAAPAWQWQRAEAGLPRQAMVLAVTADPARPERIWAGYYAAGGLATTLDGGQQWQTGAVGLADNPVFDVVAVAVDTAAGNRLDLWAATRDGLFQSVDSGQRWQLVVEQTAFAIAHDQAGSLYVGLDNGGVLKRTAAGDWRSLTAAEPVLGTAAVLSLAVSLDGQQLYAGTSGQGVFASRDGGRRWTATYPGEYAPNIALAPNAPERAVASLRTRLVRTVDSGQSWHTLPLPWARREVVSLLWLSDGVLGAGTSQGELYRSLDGGDTWQAGGTGLPRAGILALSQAAGSKLLAGTWQGLYGSHDGGQSWQNLAPTLGNPNAQTLLSTPEQLLLGARSGLYRWEAAEERWTALPDGPPSGVLSLAADPVERQTLYAGTGGDGLYRSTDAGRSWQPLPTVRKGVPALAVNPGNPAQMYLLAAWERPYESLDAGARWRAAWAGLGEVIEATSLAIDPATSDAYVGTESGLYHRANGGVWRLTAVELARQSILSLLAVARPIGSHPSMLVIGTTAGIYRSFDQGATVAGSGSGSRWGQGLENLSVTALLANPQAPRHLLAGTAYAGVYESLDNGQTWISIGPEQASEAVVESLAWGPAGELFVATTEGVWRGRR